MRLVDDAWDGLRPHLVTTRFAEDAKFRTTYIYPEVACREALTNAIAHRDYSEEGRGIDIYVFDDRIEVHNPGGLLSSMSIAEIKALRGAHQSRNSYIARALREIGVMRELGEGMRRIFELMKSSELAPPELKTDPSSFVLTLHHRPMYSKEESLWLDQYEGFSLSAEEKAVMLIGRRGDLIAPNDIIRRLGIVDIERYRQIVYSLQTKSLIETSVTKNKASRIAEQKKISVRDVPRFRIKQSREITHLRGDHSKARNGASLKNDAFPKQVALPTPVEGKRMISENKTLNETRALYLGNIPPNTSDRDVIMALAQYGVPEDVVIHKYNGLSKGFAFIEYEDADTARLVLGADIKIGDENWS